MIGMYKNTDIGISKCYTLTVNNWKVINIPVSFSEERVSKIVNLVLSRISAFEFPSSLKCSMGCTYCYIHNILKKRTEIQPSDIKKCISEIKEFFQFKGVKEFSIGFWGAEPFNDIDNFCTAVDELIKIQQEGYKIRLNFSTNGSIYTKKVEKYIEKLFDSSLCTNFQVSLDGPKEIHNRTRKNFDNIEKFCKSVLNLASKYGIKGMPYHFSATISADFWKNSFPEVWLQSSKFFLEPDTWHSQRILPLRVARSAKIPTNFSDLFYTAQKNVYEYISSNSIKGCSYYTHTLFAPFQVDPFTKSLRTVDCGGFRGQFGIDPRSGDMFTCHAGITDTALAYMFNVGNLYNKILDFKAVVRSSSVFCDVISFRGVCRTCPIGIFTYWNSICWKCISFNYLTSLNPYIYDVNFCIAFQKSFPVWVKEGYVFFDKNYAIEKILELVKNSYVLYEKIDFDMHSLSLSAIDELFSENKFNFDTQDLYDRWVGGC